MKNFIVNIAATVIDFGTTEKVIIRLKGDYHTYCSNEGIYLSKGTEMVADFYSSSANVSASIVSPKKADSLLSKGYIEL